jgi:RHS repeat-associated protein
MNTYFTFIKTVVISICLFSTHAYSQLAESKATFNHTDISGKKNKSIYATVPSGDGCIRTTTNNIAYLKLYMGDNYLFGSNTFKYEVSVDVVAYNGTKVTGTKKSYKLTADQNSPEIYQEINVLNDLALSGKTFNSIKATVTKLTATSTAGINFSSYAKMEFGHKVNYTLAVSSSITPTVTKITAPLSRQSFSWSYKYSSTTISDVPYWEFQLLKLYNTNPEKTSINDITAFVDWSQALDLFLESKATNTVLTLAEGSGFYIWRIRPVGSVYSGGVSDSRNYGVWSYSSDLISLNLSSGASTNPSCTFYYEDADLAYNNIYSRVFSQGDNTSCIKMAESKSYANGLEMPKQTQYYSQQDKTIHFNQNIYGYTSGASLSLLPVVVPSSEKSSFGFISNAVKNTSGITYTADDFMGDVTYDAPSTVDSSTSGYYDYYSDNNADKTIASSQGYPYAIVHYKEDGSGRPLESSAPGKELSMGSDHTITYKYNADLGTLSDLIPNELTYILGDETPFQNKLNKTILTDANGVKTVSYTNSQGQTIATALMSTTTISGLDKLNTADYQNPDPGVTGEEYHYTLFYYDRAGHLVKTVSPKGVSNTVANIQDHPTHEFETEYDYNFLGQMLRKLTADGGETFLYYDDLSRLRYSRDARQKEEGSFSYIKYDELGRVVESGQCSGIALTDEEALQYNNINSLTYPDDAYTKERTYVVYNTSVKTISLKNAAKTISINKSQTFLRNRISYTYTDPDGDATTIDGSYTYYSYDPHGNVIWIVQNVQGLGEKTIEYDYDVIGNRVKMLMYNRGSDEQFFQRYTYDADGRIINLETSTDSVMWEKDATYNYYTHGPLKRVQIGEDKLQGVDYTYTLSGTLKAINHPSLNTSIDPGMDGLSTSSNSLVTADAFGYSLQYYENDFYRKDSKLNANTSNEYYIKPNFSLYNNSIVAATTGMASTAETASLIHNGKMTAHKYIYDATYQLKADSFYYNNSSTTVSWAKPVKNDYSSTFKYDDNGNLASLNRLGYSSSTINSSMDKLDYNYSASSNKLDFIVDNAGSTASYTTDLESQSTGNYDYDAAGNLTQDLQEGISNIEWNVQNKIETVNKTNGEKIEYAYDAAGKRIMKKLINADGTTASYTYYVYDGNGQLVTLYTADANNVINAKEYSMLAGGKIGTYQTDATANPFRKRTLGKRYYELKDHLGNVRVVIKDIKNSTINSSSKKPEKYSVALASLTDYYAYGMDMPGRSYNSTEYRYGYQDKERDTEHNNNYNFDARILDPRIGRWLSMDPLSNKFPGISPFASMGNDPVNRIDPDGMADANAQEASVCTVSDGNGNGTPDHLENAAYSLPMASDYIKSLPKPLSGPSISTLSTADAMADRTRFEQSQKDDAANGVALTNAASSVFGLAGVLACQNNGCTTEQTAALSTTTAQVGETVLVIGVTTATQRLQNSNQPQNSTTANQNLSYIPVPSYGGSPPFAFQETSAQSLSIFDAVRNGAILYRLGTLGTSKTTDAQFWFTENPLLYVGNPVIFQNKFGIPVGNLTNGTTFLESGRLKPGSPFITRQAPGPDNTPNPYGLIEVVTNPDAVILTGFHISP